MRRVVEFKVGDVVEHNFRREPREDCWGTIEELTPRCVIVRYQDGTKVIYFRYSNQLRKISPLEILAKQSMEK